MTIKIHNPWEHLGEQGKRIRQVLEDVDEGDEMGAFEAWLEYLETHLKLPFEAIISAYEERGPLRAGDRVKVVEITGEEDLYGVLVKVKAGRKSYIFPLCRLDAVDKRSGNFTLVDDYGVWFVHR